ncbi:unnamed protein product [Medioppia subpectinata]|uniref:SURP motif domain-containing protein n=1 Tax=Medioppia subpectinata TaxID=1979941 RepID=A0A7R9KBQ4_9ACAR|nr:unnamed protein product [Medioppia subpectinata]CAG2100461.1 unnamed protein product [Medioppia subpectinata]
MTLELPSLDPKLMDKAMNKSNASRSARREQLSQQERLIEQRKQEIENKLNQLSSKESKESNNDSNDDKESTPPTLSIEPKSPQTSQVTQTVAPIDANESPAETTTTAETSAQSIVNKFQNDGSFLAKFLEMNKQKSVKQDIEPIEKTETEDSKKNIKPIKMVIKENTSKLKAISSSETSNVKLFEDDIKESLLILYDNSVATEWKTAISVTMNGAEAEDNIRQSKLEDNLYSWLRDKESENYKYYQQRVEELGEAKVRAQNDGLFDDSAESSSSSKPVKRQRKSRWSDEKVATMPSDPKLVEYAIQVFGTTELTADQWKQLEDQRKMKLLFEMLQKKQRTNQMLAKSGKVKYEYDSDEDVEDGTWEHKRRLTYHVRQAYGTSAQRGNFYIMVTHHGRQAYGTSAQRGDIYIMVTHHGRQAYGTSAQRGNFYIMVTHHGRQAYGTSAQRLEFYIMVTHHGRQAYDTSAQRGNFYIMVTYHGRQAYGTSAQRGDFYIMVTNHGRQAYGTSAQV